jgi:hypothetical protein
MSSRVEGGQRNWNKPGKNLPPSKDPLQSSLLPSGFVVEDRELPRPNPKGPLF